jgi:DNA-binding NtrC family response regulator
MVEPVVRVQAVAMLVVRSGHTGAVARSGGAGRVAAGEGLVWGESSVMRALRDRVRAVAPTRTAVLLVGETGTGKGTIARALHAGAGSRGAPFVHFDCASVPPALIEGALFGHERGAFTGAHARRAGHVEAAAGGTLFLDEIGELDRGAQARLLRLLEDRFYERIGGVRALPCTARVVAATHRDLARAVEAGSFREDLLHRLAVVVLRVPPVRERLVDLPALLARAAERARDRTGAPPPRLAPDALPVLRAHAWPGNVREVMNLMERAAACWPGRTIDATLARRLLDVDAQVRPAPRPPGRDALAGSALPSPPGGHMLEVVARCGGNVSRAARLLGVPRSTLRYRLRARQAPGRECAGPAHVQPCLPGLEPAAPDQPTKAATTRRSATSVRTPL